MFCILTSFLFSTTCNAVNVSLSHVKNKGWVHLQVLCFCRWKFWVETKSKFVYNTTNNNSIKFSFWVVILGSRHKSLVFSSYVNISGVKWFVLFIKQEVCFSLETAFYITGLHLTEGTFSSAVDKLSGFTLIGRKSDCWLQWSKGGCGMLALPVQKTGSKWSEVSVVSGAESVLRSVFFAAAEISCPVSWRLPCHFSGRCC